MATSIFNSREFLEEQTSTGAFPQYIARTDGWSPESFAREQIRGLVRQIFFSNVSQPVRQVLFTAADSQIDVTNICRQVGEALASETQASIAVVCRDATGFDESAKVQEEPAPHLVEKPVGRIPQTMNRVKSNLWFVPDAGYFRTGDVVPVGLDCPRLGYSRLAELRREFQYSIVECPPAGESSAAAAFGQLADGIVLVLAAHRTRRATARKIVGTLRAVQVQFLGTVLCERTFPVPTGIYRRL